MKTEAQLDRTQLADRRAKQAMEVTVTEGKTVWKAYPKLYMNEKSGQLMANPDVRKSFLLDLYISPQSYEPGAPARMEGTVAVLRKGEEKAFGGVNVKFVDFSSEGAHTEGGTFTIGTKLEVTSAGKTAEVTPKFIVSLGGPDGQRMENPDSPLPGTEKGLVRIRRVSPNDSAVELELLGLDPTRRPEARDARDPLHRRHDQAPHLPRLDRLLHHDARRPPRHDQAREGREAGRDRVGPGRENAGERPAGDTKRIHDGPAHSPGRFRWRARDEGRGTGDGEG